MSANRNGEDASNFAPVERWLSRPAGGQEAEDRFASLVRDAGPAEPLSAVARARVWSRLRRRPTSRARIARLRWSVALSVLLTSGVVLGALSARKWWPGNAARTVPESTPAKPRAAGGGRGLARPASQPVPTTNDPPPAGEPVPAAAPAAPPADEPVPEAAPPAPPVHAIAARHASPARAEIIAKAEPAERAADREPEAIAPPQFESAKRAPVAPSPPPAAPASALPGETPLLSGALLQLRQKRDARGALAALDEYRARYPNGTLKREAESARIDALLLLGRNDEALAELRDLTPQPGGRGQELRLIRGELTAASDCQRAVVDFDRILNEQAAAALVERALHGRAACRLRLGDEPGAIHDLSEYLRRFPAGRFAPEARRALEARRRDL
jgi:hypothetical protein